MATKKTPGTGTTRSRSKKAAGTPEATDTTNVNVSTGSDGVAVARAPEKSTVTARPNFNHPPATQEKVRQRAYELFQRRGGQHGFDVEDWLKAEAEIARR